MKRLLTSSPWGFRRYAFEDYCRFMKSIGITEICAFFADPETFPLAFRPERGEMEKKLEVAARTGVTFLEITTTGNYLEEARLAALLKVRYIRVCESWEDSSAVFASAAEKLKALGRLAAELGMTVVVENHGGLLAKASACRRLIETVALSNVRLNYDPANFLFFGEDPVAALDEILPLVGFTHCKNVRYDREDKPHYCRVSEGVIDYKRIFSRLLPVYDGCIGLEYEEPDDAEQGTADDLTAMKILLSNRQTEGR